MAEKQSARATTKPTSKRTTKKTAPSPSRVMVNEFDHPATSSGHKGAARKAPDARRRGSGKR